LEEIKSLFFNIMYLWTDVSLLVISYHDFLVLFTFTSYVFSLLVYLGAPYTFNDISITYKKKKKKKIKKRSVLLISLWWRVGDM
jgi:hypothetical protein